LKTEMDTGLSFSETPGPMLKLHSVAAKACHDCIVRRVRPKPSRKRSFYDSFKLLPYRKDYADRRIYNGCIDLLREPWHMKGTSYNRSSTRYP
jgi:hypothetical protein